MSNICLGISCTCRQDCFYGKGKVEKNSDRNKVSGTRFFQNYGMQHRPWSFPLLQWRQRWVGLPVMHVEGMWVLLVGFLLCLIVLCLPWVSTTPLWACCLTARRILQISYPLLCVALIIVRELPPSLSLSFSGELVGCSLILIHLWWPFKTLLSIKKGLTVSSWWTTPLLILLHRHHSNHRNYPLLGLITWHKSVGRIARWPWLRGPVASLELSCSSIGLWLGVPLSTTCWLAIIGLLCPVVLWQCGRAFRWSSGTAWVVPDSFSGFFGYLRLCPQIYLWDPVRFILPVHYKT